ncbi:sodium-dependent transporter [bacterium SCSIO 12696]|nr:sodium-dependent transporter [bacterium SCSIO 12696]
MAAVAGQHENWSSRFGFLMASVGFAVGLGNIWRFPYMTGENGGAAFVLVYLVCAFAIGVPILMAEVMIGRRGKLSPPASMAAVAEQEGTSKVWGAAGGMNLLTALTIQVFYCVIAGWVLSYFWKALNTGFVGIDASVAESTFNATVQDVPGMLLWTAIALGVTGFIIYRGVQDGIEKAVKVMMPTLFLLLVVLVIYHMFAGGFPEAVDYLFSADFSKITGAVWLAAIGQAFFSVGVGMAGMMTFGAYLPKSISISKSVFIIVLADTFVALLAGFAIFPAVFANGLDPQSGPGLIFKTLPVAFSQMPGGYGVSIVFFMLLSVAAITSMVGLLEPLISWAEERKNTSRQKSAVIITLITAAISVLSILAFSGKMTWTLSDIFAIKPEDPGSFLYLTFGDLMDAFSSRLLLPLGGLFIAIFAGWFISRKSSFEELDIHNPLVYQAWRFFIRFVAPVAVLIILFRGITE